MNGLVADVRDAARGWRWMRRPLVPRSAEPHTELPQRPEFPTAWARSRAAAGVREVVQAAGLDPLLRAEVRPVVNGLDHLGGLHSPVLFVANHTSHLDTPLVLCSLPPSWRRHTAVAAASDYFFDTWWRAVGSALAFNTFPVDRYGRVPTQTIQRVLDEGWNVLIFPEGTRSPDGWTRRFRAGAAHVAMSRRLPVVPIGIRGAYAAMPRGRGWPAPGRPPVHVRFGPPLWPAGERSTATFARRISGAVDQLLREDATTWWDSLRPTSAVPTPAAPWRRVWVASLPPADGRRRAWR